MDLGCTIWNMLDLRKCTNWLEMSPGVSDKNLSDCSPFYPFWGNLLILLWNPFTFQSEAMHCKSVAAAFLIAMAACDVRKFVKAARKQRAATWPIDLTTALPAKKIKSMILSCFLNMRNSLVAWIANLQNKIGSILVFMYCVLQPFGHNKGFLGLWHLHGCHETFWQWCQLFILALV